MGFEWVVVVVEEDLDGLPGMQDESVEPAGV